MVVPLGALFDSLPPGVVGAGSLTGIEARLQEATARELGARDLWTHLDVMDQAFAGRSGIEPARITGLLRASGRSDVHLMVDDPDAVLAGVLAASPDRVTVHPERLADPAATARRIRDAGVSPWVAVGPDPGYSTDVVALFDGVLVMLIRPGSSDVADPACAGLVATLAGATVGATVGVDGGVTADNLHLWLDAGAGYLVAGRSLFEPIACATY